MRKYNFPNFFVLNFIFIPKSRNSSLIGSPPEFCLGKGILKICSKFTGEYPCRSVILIKLLLNFIEIVLWYGCSPVNLLHIFRTPFPRNTSGELLLPGLFLVKWHPVNNNKLNFSNSRNWTFFFPTLPRFGNTVISIALTKRQYKAHL